MVCIYCSEKTHVINSRSQKRMNQVWRRRECFACDAIFTTTESAQYETAWRVRSPQGAQEPFNRDKLLLSLYESCKHRKTALNDATALTETVIKKLLGQVIDGSLERRIIAQTAQVALNRFDKAASVHYAAFHTY